jgi:hypothetical protein
MTHDELIAIIDVNSMVNPKPLLEVIKLHSPIGTVCGWCTCYEDNHIVDYPCKTIKIIEFNLR